MELETRMKRWRLILGEESRPQFGKMGGVELTDEQLLMDQALASIYNQTDSGGFGDGSGKKVPGRRKRPFCPCPFQMAGGCQNPV